MPTLTLSPLFALLLQPSVEGPAPPPLDTEIPVRSEPLPPPAQRTAAAWSAERRRLQLHTGLSGAFAGAMILAGTLLMTLPDSCQGDFCEFNYARFIPALTILPLATIPITTGIVHGVRLHRHNQARPTAVLRARAGGFVLQF